jgi:hypothetical protein
MLLIPTVRFRIRTYGVVMVVCQKPFLLSVKIWLNRVCPPVTSSPYIESYIVSFSYCQLRHHFDVALEVRRIQLSQVRPAGFASHKAVEQR